MLRCIFVPNLEIVTSIGGELWQGKAQNEVNFDVGVQFNLEGHDQSSRKTIGILTKVFYISGLNLVILSEMGDELSPELDPLFQKFNFCDFRSQFS